MGAAPTGFLLGKLHHPHHLLPCYGLAVLSCPVPSPFCFAVLPCYGLAVLSLADPYRAAVPPNLAQCYLVAVLLSSIVRKTYRAGPYTPACRGSPPRQPCHNQRNASNRSWLGSPHGRSWTTRGHCRPRHRSSTKVSVHRVAPPKRASGHQPPTCSGFVDAPGTVCASNSIHVRVFMTALPVPLHRCSSALAVPHTSSAAPMLL